MFNILVAEDDKNLSRLMSAFLRHGGYKCITAENGSEALQILENQHIDMIIADIMMPLMDGYELCESIRDSGMNIPIMIVTVKDKYNDKEKGFLAGADDYMVKPVDMNEMLLRVRALLRRYKIVNERILSVGSLTLTYDTLTVEQDGKSIALPQKEFYLLFKLLSYPDHIFTRRQLMDEIWGMNTEADERTVDVHIKRLREHFENSTDFKIVTVRGLGYKLVKNNEK